MSQFIKIKALALICNAHRILLEEVREGDGTLKGLRPLGGTIEFGEKAADALKREFLEELAADIDILSLHSVSESIFTYREQASHEIIFVYEAKLRDIGLYQQYFIERIDTLHAIPIKAIWIDPKRTPGNVPIFPDDFARQLKLSQVST